MSNTNLWLILLAAALSTLIVRTHVIEDRYVEHSKFYELKKGNIHANFTNFGARIVSLYVPDKFGREADIVLGYDTIFEYEKDRYSLGAIVGRVHGKFDNAGNVRNNYGTGGRVGLSNVNWKVIKFENFEKDPYISFQYDSRDDEEGPLGNLIITATYLLHAKNKLELKLSAETRDNETDLNIALNTYWNLGGHNSPRNILHDHLRILATHYTPLSKHLIPEDEIYPINHTPYDFLHYHQIQSRIQRLKHGYNVDYMLDQTKEKGVYHDMDLAAVVRDKISGRVMKVWTDQRLLQFRSGDELKNVEGKGGVYYQKNAGLVLTAQCYPDSESVSFPEVNVTRYHPYNQTTIFQFLVKKKKK